MFRKLNITSSGIDTDTTASFYYTGEFWCTVLWEMTWELVKNHRHKQNFFDATQANPGGNSVAMNLVIKGLQLEKCSGGCVDARDAILQADTALYDAKYSNELWAAFARRGLGVGADQGSANKRKDGIGDYGTPLPVIWGSFTAEKQNKSVLSEMDHMHRNKTQINLWLKEAATVLILKRSVRLKPQETATAVSSYKYTDFKPLNGKNYFRIKEVDLDGKAFLFSGERCYNERY